MSFLKLYPYFMGHFACPKRLSLLMSYIVHLVLYNVNMTIILSLKTIMQVLNTVFPQVTVNVNTDC